MPVGEKTHHRGTEGTEEAQRRWIGFRVWGLGVRKHSPEGAVNVLDLVELLLCFGQPASPPCDIADINADGTVNVLDLITLLLAFGTTCP